MQAPRTTPPRGGVVIAAVAASAGARVAALVASCIGWLAGTAAQMQLPALPAPAAAWMGLAAALVAATVLVVAARAPRAFDPGSTRPAVRALLWFVVAAAAAFSAATLRAHGRLAERLPAVLEGRDIVVTGLVAQLPRSSVQGTRFLFEPETAVLEGRPVALPRRLSLAWYRAAEADALLLGPQLDVRAGQRWRFTVRLRQPHGPLNPGGFDLELWLFERGIGATGQVRARAGDAAVLLEEAAGAPVERARQQVRDAIERRLLAGGAAGAADAADRADPAAASLAARTAGVIAALALGDQAAIERDDWEVFRVTGVAHLMSISGLHVTMFAWLAGGVIGWLWRRAGRASLWLPAPRAAAWGGVAVALAYALFAGWGVPAQRTVIMLATVAALKSLGVRWPLHAVLALVAAVVIAIDPWACTQPGFWLSFVAVALLAAAEPAMARVGAEAAPGSPAAVRALPMLRAAVRAQAVATVGLAPPSMVFFQQVSIVGFAANLVAIPVVTLVVTPLALLGIAFAPLWDAAAFVLSLLMAALQMLAGGAAAGLPAVWQAAAAPPWAVAAGLLGGVLAVLPLPARLRWLAVPLMLPLLAPPAARPAPGMFEVVAADVGQGTAVLVRTRHHLLVYDAGPAFSPEADAGSRWLVPLLRLRGETQIDQLMLSHRDTDHTGGAASLLAALPVRQLSSSLDDVHPLQARARAAGATIERCVAGQRWQWDGVPFEVLHPTADDYAQAGPALQTAQAAPRPNTLSCVLRIGTGDAAVLLTGDIEAAEEAALVARASTAQLRARALLVPHHGSRTSSTAAFIDAVAPSLAVVQAAYRSRFGHPAPDVVSRYEARGIRLVRSDRCGALTLTAHEPPRCEREAARRYWHHRAASAPASAPRP